MNQSERNRLLKTQRALALGFIDMGHAQAALEALDREHHDVDLMRALETAIAVSYARAFTTSSLLRLSADNYRPDDQELADAHDYLLYLRDKVYAHTDKDGGRSASVVILTTTDDEGLVRVVARVDEEWVPLDRGKIPVLRRLLEKVAGELAMDAAEIQRQLQE